MTNHELKSRRDKAVRETLVIAKTEDGFQVHAPADPDKVYLVTGSAENPHCTCPDFQYHNGDPNWRCKHILAVLAKVQERESRATQGELDEERAAIQGEGAPPAKPKRERKSQVNGTKTTEMLIKRSVSPDGRIDSVSIEFSMPVDGAPLREIKDRALKTLQLQNEIADGFLKLNGRNGNATRNGNGQAGNGAAPSSQAAGQAIPARLVDIGASDGQYGERLFIGVNVSGKRLRLYGSAKQLAAYIGYAGHQIDGSDLEPGLRLDLPCRVVLTKNGNGYLTVTRVLRPALPKQEGRRQWQSQRA